MTIEAHTRRNVLALAAAGSAMLAAPSVIRAQTRKIVVRDLGIGTSFMDAYGKAFAEATGIQAQPVTGANDPLGQIKQMVEAKTYTWDMSIVTRQVANQLSRNGADYLEPLKIEDAAGWKAMPEMFKSPVYAGNDVVATVLGYRTDTLKLPPRSWVDFFDADRFSGRRAMRRSPVDSIEQALLADGVAGDKLFPLDFDRGFKALDRMKKNVAAWWTSGAQSTQLLQSGEVDFCPSWNGRLRSCGINRSGNRKAGSSSKERRTPISVANSSSSRWRLSDRQSSPRPPDTDQPSRRRSTISTLRSRRRCRRIPTTARTRSSSTSIFGQRRGTRRPIASTNGSSPDRAVRRAGHGPMNSGAIVRPGIALNHWRNRAAFQA